MKTDPLDRAAVLAALQNILECQQSGRTNAARVQLEMLEKHVREGDGYDARGPRQD